MKKKSNKYLQVSMFHFVKLLVVTVVIGLLNHASGQTLNIVSAVIIHKQLAH